MSVPKRYPEEFRRKVLDLVAAGRPVRMVRALRAALGTEQDTVSRVGRQLGYRCGVGAPLVLRRA